MQCNRLVVWGRICLAVMLSLGCGFVAAQPALAQQYQVEVLVFQDVSESDEAEPAQVVTRPYRFALGRVIELTAASALEADNEVLEKPQALQSAPQSFQLLGAGYWQLLEETRALLTHEQYRLILHSAWQQPIDSHPRVVHFFGGQAYDGQGASLSMGFSEQIQQQDVPVYWQIDGTLAITRHRYFDMNANVQMLALGHGYPHVAMADAEPASDTPAGPAVYWLAQKRRTRSGVLNFFDHPRFGLLVKIIPIPVDTPVAMAAPLNAPLDVLPTHHYEDSLSGAADKPAQEKDL